MTEYDKAIEIVKTLQNNGYEAMFVGGWVRDKIIGIPSHDIDIVTSARQHEILEVFGDDCNCVNATQFNVNLVFGIEVVTYRYDIEDGTTLFAECFIEDSNRRDLTINSIGYDPISDKYYDFNNGVADIENKIIRFVGIAEMRIIEDPVRMLRACRFASKTGYRLVPSAFYAIKDNADMIISVPAERIQIELLKAMDADKPSIFFELLQRTGLLRLIMPEMDDCWFHDGGKYHSEFVHEHLLACGDYLDADHNTTGNPLVRLAGYLHDIGKVVAYDEYDYSFIGHERFGADLVRDVLSRLKFTNKDIEKVCSLVLCHMRVVGTDATPKACRKTIVKLSKHGVNVSEFLDLKIADRYANQRVFDYTDQEICKIKSNFYTAFDSGDKKFSLKDLKINGRDVINAGVKPGKCVGAVLKYYFDLVVDDPTLNDREILLDRLGVDNIFDKELADITTKL